MSPLEGVANCDYNQSGGEDQIQSLSYVLKKEKKMNYKKKWIKNVTG